MTDVAAPVQRAPLAQIWRFVCVERQLTKKDVLDADIPIEITRMIQSAAAPTGLRVNSQLLLGVVRVYKQKVRFLLDDCDQALAQIRWMRQGRVQCSSIPTMRQPPPLGMAAPRMTFATDAEPSPNGLSQSRFVAGDVILGSRILKADLDTNIQAYVEDKYFERPKRTFAEMIQSDRTETRQKEDSCNSDFSDVELDLDLGDSPLFVTSPTMRSCSWGSAGPPSPASEYQRAATSEMCDGPVDVVRSEVKRHRKRQRVLAVKDQETVIPLADLKRQQLNRSGILKPRAPRSATLLNLQRTLANNFALSTVQGPQHCAPELRQYLHIDFIRANNTVASDDAVDTKDLQLLDSDSHTGDECASSQSDYTPLQAWSDEGIQPFRNRLVSAASGGATLFQDAVLGLATQDITACFVELLAMATEGAVDIEQRIEFGEIWIHSSREIK
ncbi:MAG: hypothetical protein LQ346_005350 [Caloplaca aetnensis]|nr:MAG: hypothetical protein LQ346_005350 [Caloplaca aetnensis]